MHVSCVLFVCVLAALRMKLRHATRGNRIVCGIGQVAHTRALPSRLLRTRPQVVAVTTATHTTQTPHIVATSGRRVTQTGLLRRFSAIIIIIIIIIIIGAMSA